MIELLKDGAPVDLGPGNYEIRWTVAEQPPVEPPVEPPPVDPPIEPPVEPPTPPVGKPGGTLIMHERFDFQDALINSSTERPFGNSGNWRTSMDGGSVRVQDEIKFRGERAVRFDLNYNAKMFRAELVQARGKPRIGERWQYKWRIYLPASFSADSVSELVTQWHYEPPFGWLGLRIENGIWRFLSQNKYDGAMQSGIGKTNLGNTSASIDRFTTFVMDILYTESNAGRIRLWMDGESKYDKSNIITVPPSQKLTDGVASMKIGLYKSDWGAGARPHKGEVDSRMLCHGPVEIYKDADPMILIRTP